MAAMMQKAHMAKAALRSQELTRPLALTADELLRTIRRLYQAAQALPASMKPTAGRVTGSAEYRARVAEIRDCADRFKELTGT